jgi:acetyltransferase
MDAPALATRLKVKDGEVDVRPIRAEDAEALVEMIRKADPRDVRARFHAAIREVPRSWIARLTQIDYSQEMALIALVGTEIVCVARLVCDPGCETGEFALAVRSDQQRRGIGRGMMGLLVDYARKRGMKRMWGMIESDNERMIALARELGFHAEGPPSFGEVRMDLAR